YVALLIVRAGTLESLPALVVVTTHMALGREYLYTLRARVLVRETLIRIKPTVATRLAHRPLLIVSYAGFIGWCVYPSTPLLVCCGSGVVGFCINCEHPTSIIHLAEECLSGYVQRTEALSHWGSGLRRQ